MPSPGLVARITRARRSLERLRRLAEMSWEEYSSDEDAQVLTERHLHIVLEAILDLAAFIVARLGLAVGPTYRDTVKAIVAQGIITGRDAEVLQSIPGMRNILVHGYAEVRHDIIYDTLRNELSVLQRILEKLWRKATELDP